MLDSVENDLIQRRPTWGDVTDPMDPELISMLLEWAWTQRELQAAVDEAYQPGISIFAHRIRAFIHQHASPHARSLQRTLFCSQLPSVWGRARRETDWSRCF